MPDPDEDDLSIEELREREKSLIALGEMFPGTTLHELGEELRQGGGWPELLSGTPMVIDTDIGGDPDDAIALVAAARAVPSLSLVLTNDETGPAIGYGARSRFARVLLDSLGRHDVQVVAGHSSGDTRYFCVEQLIPDSVPPQPSDVVAAVRDLLQASSGPIRWVGIGAFSNLAKVLREIPEAGRRLQVTQMGGGLNYRDPSRAEHNVRMDVASAHEVFAARKDGRIRRLNLVTSDVTFTGKIEITRASSFYTFLRENQETGWPDLLLQHLELWFGSFYPGTIQHDPLTLSAALQMAFVDLDPTNIELDEAGRMTADENGVQVWMSISADYEPFNEWLSEVLTSKDFRTDIRR
ncbi:nucleoside hydrolase [Nocardiopsis rhodophaea]|uniref:nucleoside hydrolase n=1 Tax=Nocardiopsis rhodophaea TaxID=280238 RepID=UPI0031DDA639